MEGYDSRKNIIESWTYTDLLEMIYVEDLKAINSHKAQKAYEEKQELEDLLKNG
jgi:hypothetical protein